MMKSSVDKVSHERWKEAQQLEEKHWVETEKTRARFFKNYIWGALAKMGFMPKHRGDDWNIWWRDRFDGYKFLPSRVSSAIEIGCGPYTNIRHVMLRSAVDHLVLSDPLIRTYVNFPHTFVRDQYRRAACTLDAHPAEQLPFADGVFDVSVMINVLDHVRDASECMRQFIRVTKPGGCIIFGQDLTDEADIRKLGTIGGDGETMHPIKLDENWVRPFFKDRFDVHIDKVLRREEGRAPDHHYATLLFAGSKRA